MCTSCSGQQSPGHLTGKLRDPHVGNSCLLLFVDMLESHTVGRQHPVEPCSWLRQFPMCQVVAPAVET